jgi:hypothetical protein
VKVIFFLALLLSACSTTNRAKNNKSLDAFCENGRSKKQYVFQLASYTGVQHGTPISEVKKIIESQNQTNDFIREHFIEALLAYYMDSANESFTQSFKFHNVFAAKFQKGWSPALPHLVWVEDNLFAVCEDGICNGMPFPEKPKVTIAFDYQKWNDGRCTDFFLSDGYVSGLGCYGNERGLLSYLKDSGFNGGWLVANRYVDLPEHERKNLCTKHGNPDCAEIKEDNNQIKNLQNRSITLMDLLVKDGTKVSTKVLNNWNLYRITWDPSPICKYSRSNDDFLTH